MTRRKRSVVLVVLLALALGSSSAHAVTLMVNGDTPSRRWQRVADRALTPTPSGEVALYLAPCPSYMGDDVRTYLTAAGCAGLDPPVTIWLTPDSPPIMRRVLLHELGHIFDEQELQDSDREAFRLIWRRPTIGWWAELAPFDPEKSFWGPDGLHGQPSMAGEWFADTYQWCATHRLGNPWVRWMAVGDLQYVTASVTLGYMHSEMRAYRRLAATCRLIHRAAR